MKIMLFLHGTAIMHESGKGVSREERMRQVQLGDESIFAFEAYVPIGNVVEKLIKWRDQGVEIIYLSSHIKEDNIKKDEAVLKANNFPDGEIYYRKGNEAYKDVVSRVIPDILIEDDCESIGGEREMTYPSLGKKLRGRVKSIVVKEFGGIDHLPDDAANLESYG